MSGAWLIIQILYSVGVLFHVRHLGGPQGEVIPEQLHDQRGIFVRFLTQVVQFGDRVVECSLVKRKAHKK